MGLSLRGSTSGSIDINPPAVAGNNTITLPGDNGSANQFFRNSTTAGIVTYSSMVEDSSGNIGIGTDNPIRRLHVQSPGSISNALFGNSANNNSIEVTRTGSTGSYFQVQTYTNICNVVGGPTLTFRTSDPVGSASTERLRIDSSGRVKIGNDANYSAATGSKLAVELMTTAGTILEIADQTDGFSTFESVKNAGGGATDYGGYIFSGRRDADDDIKEYLRIDSSGRLLVGVTSTSVNTRFLVKNNATSSGPGSLCVGTVTVTPTNGATIGAQQFLSSADANTAEIRVRRDGGTWTNGTSHPTRLEFSTTADGASSPTERMRISHSGGTSHFATAAAHGFRATQTAGTDSILFVQNNSSSVTTGSNVFIVRADGDVENATGNYTAFSDQKLKENIVDANSQWDDIKSIQIRNFNFKEETGLPTHTQIGVIAQELEQICPNLVKDVKVTNDGEDTYKTVKSSILYMKTVKALQEAMERIETLETANASQAVTIAALDARLTALEGA
jgi:hypothetical protein